MGVGQRAGSALPASSIGAIANVGIATYLFAVQETPWLLSTIVGAGRCRLGLHPNIPLQMEASLRTELRPSLLAGGVNKGHRLSGWTVATSP